jgi:hypothetical protein
MATRLLRHFRSNIVAYIALMVALSGTTYAVNGTLPGKNTVGSADIINDEVRASDVGRGQIRTTHVRNDDLTNGGLRGDDIANESLSGEDVALNSLGSADIHEETLGTVPTARSAALGGTGRSAYNGACDPESNTYVDCGTLNPSLTLPQAARVLVIGTAEGRNEIDADEYMGSCRLWVDGQGFGPFASFRGTEGSETATMVGVTDVLTGGTHSFKVRCYQSEISGAIVYSDVSITAVVLSAN